MRFARMVGRQEFDKAIEYLRAGLKGDASDQNSLELIADCYHWAGRNEEAITACREALAANPVSFDMHAMLAQLLANKGEHENAATHARKGLESYPEPLPEIPPSIISAFKFLSRIMPRLFSAPPPDEALKRVYEWRAGWFDWAKSYLSWYDQTYGEKVKPIEH